MLSIVSVGVRAQDTTILDVCSLPVIGNTMLEGAAGTTIGNYRVSIRTEAGNRRFYLPDTTFDLHGLVVGGSLGSAVTNDERSNLIGMWYTFEPVDPAQTAEAFARSATAISTAMDAPTSSGSTRPGACA